jgi:hypothetical protein
MLHLFFEYLQGRMNQGTIKGVGSKSRALPLLWWRCATARHHHLLGTTRTAHHFLRTTGARTAHLLWSTRARASHLLGTTRATHHLLGATSCGTTRHRSLTGSRTRGRIVNSGSGSTIAAVGVGVVSLRHDRLLGLAEVGIGIATKTGSDEDLLALVQATLRSLGARRPDVLDLLALETSNHHSLNNR